MIADQLAMELSDRFVEPGKRVLDPFCGTGRTLLAAAERGAECVGIDVNPLAILLTRAKSSNPRPSILEDLLLRFSKRIGNSRTCPSKDLEVGRRVEWFSPKTRTEVSALINWINDTHLELEELNFVAAVLSATVREVSYCKDDQWKLHRMSREARARFFKSPWAVFERRLRSALQDLSHFTHLQGTIHSIAGDARRLSHVLQECGENSCFDLVLTSPPYGDSQTTVQYGGMSGICLGVLRHLRGLDIEIISGGEIDRRCLGGRALEMEELKLGAQVLRPRYWHGGVKNSARNRVHRFLWELELCCREITRVLKRGGQAVFVIARRSIGGWRLNLDRFLMDSFMRKNLLLDGICTRQIEGKVTPAVINRHGRSVGKEYFGNRVHTMREEHILVFRKV
jgi:16S rRNA G966 N2-methylase RsmD